MASMMAKLNTSSHLITDHPYYPLEVEIAAYLANEWSVPLLLGVFFSLCGTVVLGTKHMVNKVHPNLPTSEKAVIWWLVICKCPADQLAQLSAMLIFERSRINPSLLRRYDAQPWGNTMTRTKLMNTGYFSLNHFQMGPAQDLFGQLWKEYALSDSRYLTSDPFVLCMETVTAVRAPPPALESRR